MCFFLILSELRNGTGGPRLGLGNLYIVTNNVHAVKMTTIVILVVVEFW